MVTVERPNDGKYEHRFRQSDLNTFMHCPEQLRDRWMRSEREPSTDSQVLGSACHAGIEFELSNGGPVPLGGGMSWDGHDVIEQYLNEAQQEGWTYTKFSIQQVYDRAHYAFQLWCDQIAPLIDPIEVEHTFTRLAWEDTERRIYWTGTYDCLDKQGVVWDWKTATRDYDAWEYQRWAIQPTVYTHATGSDLFSYGVMNHDKGNVQVIPIWRSDAHHAWLCAQSVGLARLIEAGLERWPMNDQGWWCSEQWCPNWQACKGAYMPDDWKLSFAKREAMTAKGSLTKEKV